MLKRTLTIGILTVLALVLAAAGPPVSPTPPAPPTPENAISAGTIPYWNSSNQISYDNGREVITLFWGTYTGERSSSAPSLHDAPATHRMDFEIPEEALALLPPERRARFKRFNQQGGATASMNDDDEWDCGRRVSYPYIEGEEVEAYGGISCLGESITHTRVSVILTRGSTILEPYDSGWKTWLSHGRTVDGPCASGTNSYTNRVWVGIRFDDGEEGGDEWVGSKDLTC